ncbi:hypothetical protein BEP19_07385 [Ammoniphilus oxalaticus]|uniref:Uncharacterized protein n=1 Tax=Ammoniphilus oxalaticus TaxID=66863 RepID=A0A419SJV8_9BACL|nr:flagellar hook-basal body protein [Ammoniphilus oxalaticus]RKD24219.1 hypothetical protein BEP19_07385 [Ammoniphilus oxalaticus]
MNTSLYISNGALQAYQQRLDTVSYNIANVNTVGYKQREASFAENLATEVDNQPNRDEEIGRRSPHEIRVGYGARLGQTSINMKQGGAKETGQPFDIMVEGDGLFVVSDETGALRYTRDGAFKQSPAEEEDFYYLVTAQGDYLLDDFGEPLEIDTGYDVKLLENGDIQLTNQADPTDAWIHWQRIGLVQVNNPQLLRSVGDNQYALDEEAISAGAVEPLDLDDADAPKLRQGFLETSNVNIAKEMSELLISQRGFQMNARAVSFADQMLGVANGIINR